MGAKICAESFQKAEKPGRKSRVMPRNLMEVLGPDVFSSERGTDVKS